MLGDYKECQSVIYNVLSNEIVNDKVSHAYLFDISSNYNYFPFIYAFIKSMLCPQKRMINDGCQECNLCKSIDDNNFPDIFLIEASNTVITKEQLINLQHDFMTTSLYNKKRIYIIKYAENLHISAANSILKFLEEPENNIVAILLTKNEVNVLPTIVSRCQVLKLAGTNKNDIKYKIGQVLIDDIDAYNDFIESNNNEIIENTVKFILYYETHGIDVLAHATKMWFEIYTDIKKNVIAYNLMLLFYKDVVNYKLNREIDIYGAFLDSLEKVATKNEFDVIYKKIYLINEAIKKNKVNINLALNLDNLIIEMEELK